MKKLFITSFILVSTFLGISQSQKDSLIWTYLTGEADAQTLNMLAAEHYSSNIDSGRMFAQMALEYAQVVENNEHIGEAYYQLGDAAYYSGKTDSCLFYYLNSLEFYLKTNKNNEIAGVYNDIGQVLQIMSFHDSANIYFDLSLDYLDKDLLPEAYYSILINKGTSFYAEGSYALANEVFLRIIKEAKGILSIDVLSVVYSNLGLSYKKSSNFGEAIKYYEKAYQIDDSLSLQYNKAIDLANIGGVYYSWKQYEEAQSYFNKSLETYRSLEDIRGEASVLSNLAAAQKANNQLKEAQSNYQKALDLAILTNDNFYIGTAYHGLGIIEIEQANYHKSISYAEKAIQYFELTKRPYPLANAYLSIARSTIALKQYTKAANSLSQAQEYATATSSLELNRDVALQYAKYYSILSENKKSNNYYKKFIQLNDSIFNQKSHRLITEFNIKLKTLEQQREMENISLENELIETKISQKNILIIVLICSIAIIILGFIIVLRIYDQKQKTLQILYEKSKTEFASAKKLDLCQKDIIKAGISDSLMKDLLEKLHYKIEEEKVFLQSDLSIHKLANLMDTNTSYLSKIINDYYHQNFNSFINKYRIRTAQEMMHQNKYQKYTVEAIAHECGFRSKSSFNEAFKKINGLTPGFYIQKINSEN